jgi:putative alpha-1,2-mannosidase
MIGDHCPVLMVDAFLKRIISVDDPLLLPVYDAMRRNAFDSPEQKDYAVSKGRRALKPYLELGFIPLDEPILESPHPGQQV